METPHLSIVLPCYNEADNIPLILQRFRDVKGETPVELILVNNGSTDHSGAVLKQELSKPENRFGRSLEILKNRGYGDGLWKGLCDAKGDFLAYSHADLQCDPKDIFVAYDKLKGLTDPKEALVKGRRMNRRAVEALVTRGHQLTASFLLGQRLEDINGQPKLFHKSLLQELRNPPIDFSFDLYILYKTLKSGRRVETVPVNFGTRRYGKSHWASSMRSKLKTYRRAFQYIVTLKRSGE